MFSCGLFCVKVRIFVVEFLTINMIKKYFIAQGSNTEGPYSIEELKNKDITDQYLIWTSGMSSWINVQEFAELQDVVQKSPPQTPYEIKKQKKIATIQGTLILSFVVHIFVGVIVFILAGGFLNGDDLVRISRNMPKPIYFADGWDAKRFYVIFFFLLMPWPISLVNAYFSHKAINKNPEYTKKAAKIIFILGSILIAITLFLSHNYFVARYLLILASAVVPATQADAADLLTNVIMLIVGIILILLKHFASHQYFGARYPAKFASPVAFYETPVEAPALTAKEVQAVEAVAAAVVDEETVELLVKFVPIRGGEFTMGSPVSEAYHQDDETQHQVRVSDFSMSKYAVTVAEFKRFVDATGYCTDAEKMSNTKNWRYGVSGVRPQSEEDHPVVYVSWNDAVAYAKWLSVKTGKYFRLPTEAEREYACRAGSRMPFDTEENLTTNQANFNGNYFYNDHPKGVYRQNTVAVNSFTPNALGLYNMHGNVWEWCSDWYGKTYYEECKASGTVTNPAGPESGSYRVIRGGGWDYFAEYCRSACRNSRSSASRNSHVGFRLIYCN